MVVSNELILTGRAERWSSTVSAKKRVVVSEDGQMEVDASTPVPMKTYAEVGTQANIAEGPAAVRKWSDVVRAGTGGTRKVRDEKPTPGGSRQNIDTDAVSSAGSSSAVRGATAAVAMSRKEECNSEVVVPAAAVSPRSGGERRQPKGIRRRRRSSGRRRGEAGNESEDQRP
jgi:hypothetical protein